MTSRFGDPEVEQATIFANAGVNITEALQLYGWVGYQDRDSKSAAFPRIPSVVGAAYHDQRVATNAVEVRRQGGFGVIGSVRWLPTAPDATVTNVERLTVGTL